MSDAKSGNGSFVLADGDEMVFRVTGRTIEIRFDRGDTELFRVELPHDHGDDPTPTIVSVVRLMEAATGMVVTLECTKRSDDLIYRFEGA